MGNLDLLLPSPAGDSMTMLWGTVTADGSAVLLDGDTVPLPASTPSLVPLRANVRVAVDRYGKGVRIVGEVAPPVASPGLIAAVAAALYPVGSIYLSVVNTNPGALFGGTWVAWGSGKVPVGVDTAQTEFNTVEKIGGEKTHLLTADESGLPSHNHTQNAHSHSNGFFPGWIVSGGQSGNGRGQDGYLYPTGSLTGGATATNIANAAGDAASAHNNMPPYVTCWMFKRTA